MIKYRFCNIATQRVFCCVNAPSRKSFNDRYQTASMQTLINNVEAKLYKRYKTFQIGQLEHKCY
jgi:hypothetical protein